MAVTENQVRIARMLLEAGANPNLKDYKGFTLLTYTVAHDQLRMARLLLENGVDVNATSASDISHRDGRKGNFLVSTLPQQSNIFSIDNGLAFGGLGKPRPLVIRWSELKVDKLPQATVARLQAITSEQLQNVLGTVAEQRIEPDGRLQHVPPSENLNPPVGFRQQDNILQIGLTVTEIAGIEARLRDLLKQIDSGDIQLF